MTVDIGGREIRSHRYRPARAWDGYPNTFRGNFLFLWHRTWFGQLWREMQAMRAAGPKLYP